jgi:hypothetical protein
MARLKNIPPNLYDAIAEQSAKGQAAREIVIWLKNTHNITSSVPSICRLLKETKEERQQIAQRAYANAVAKSANQDLEILGDVITKCKQRFDILVESHEDFKAKGIAEVMFKYIAKRMDLSGINDKSSDDQLLKEELLKKISEL